MKYTDQLVKADQPTAMSNEEYLMTKEELEKLNGCQLRDYEINIRFLSRGMTIRVGCKEIPFETIDKGMAALNDYVANPCEEAGKWMKILK